MENNNQNSSKFLNGFLLGALIGAGVVFFLNTKKGKKVLKLISQEGLNNISDLLNQEDNLGEDYEEEQEPLKTSASSHISTSDNKTGSNGEEKKPLIRRFFRGISKRSL